MKKILVFTVLLLLAGVAIGPFLSFNAKASVNTTFTTTANFDSGTKSQPVPADGNYQIETTTDNPGITSGSIELSSLKGDAFNFADSDATTFKWATKEYRGGTDGGNEIANINITEPGALYLKFTTGNANTDSWGVTSKTNLSGNLDIETFANRQGAESATRAWFSLLNENVASCESSATVDGIVYEHYWQTGPSNRLLAYTCTNGVKAQIGSSTITADTVDYYMRITRIGSTVVWYYSTTGTLWTQDETTSFSTSQWLWVALHINANGGGRVPIWAFTYFKMNSGYLNGGSRTSGSWVSNPQSQTTHVFRSVQVDYSGADASNYLTSIYLLSNLGAYPFVDNTDLTSGTTHTYHPNITISGAWRIGFNLTGNSSATSTILTMIVQVNDAPAMSMITSVPLIPSSNETTELVSDAVDTDGTLNYTWSFGDGNVSYDDTPSHIYVLPGVYHVQLTVRDNNTETAYAFMYLQITPGSVLDMDVVIIILLFVAFTILLIFGLVERFAMVGAAIVAFFIAIESWVITTNVVLPTMFVFIGVVCIGVSITRRV
jgi:hypothetical protein